MYKDKKKSHRRTGFCIFLFGATAYWTRQQKICSVSIEKSMIQFLHEVFTKTESRSWVAASQMWRAGIKVQDAKQGGDCQNGRWRRQRGQGESDGWFLERVWECEIISFWYFFCRIIQVLVSTDCAGMGVHVPDLRLVVNVGMTMIEIFSQIGPCTHWPFRTSKELVEGASDIWAGWTRQEVSSSWRTDVLARPERSFDLDFLLAPQCT